MIGKGKNGVRRKNTRGEEKKNYRKENNQKLLFLCYQNIF
jgi:hypothetical protein